MINLGSALTDAGSGIRAMRLSMIGSPQHANVSMFLAPLIVTQSFPKTVADARAEYLRMLEEAISAIAREPELRAIYDAGAQWASGAISTNYLYLYRFFARPGQTPLSTFLAITYLRALRALVANNESETAAVFTGLAPFLRNMAEVRSQAEGPIRRNGPDFIAHLVVETEVRAREEPQWATSLDLAYRDFERLDAHVAPLVARAFGQAPQNLSIAAVGPERIALAGNPAEAWWRAPAMVSLSCIYLRCASQAER